MQRLLEDISLSLNVWYSKERMEWDILFAIIITAVSYRSTCARVKQSALLVEDNRIISIGYNGAAAGQTHCIDQGDKSDASGSCLYCVHAEHNCLGYAARNGIKTDGCTIYVTMTPCINCSKLIVASGIKEYKYLSEYRLKEGKDFLLSNNVKVTKL